MEENLDDLSLEELAEAARNCRGIIESQRGRLRNIKSVVVKKAALRSAGQKLATFTPAELEALGIVPDDDGGEESE